MPSVGIRELQRDTSGIVGRVAETRRPVFVTNRGDVVAVVLPVDSEALEDFALANAPEYVRSMEEADLALIEGRTRSSDEVFAELEGTPTPRAEPVREMVSSLTGREREILVLVARERSNEEIAGELSISPETVKTHVRAILRKLHLHAEMESRVTAGGTSRSSSRVTTDRT